MRRRRKQRGASVLASSFVVSAAIHLLFGINLKDLAEAYLASAGPAPPVKVVRLSEAQWSKNLQARSRQNPLLKTQPQALGEVAKAEAPPPPKKEEPKPEPASKLSGQIVEVPPTRDDRPNPDAKYLSKYNTHVEKETSARMEDRDPNKKRVTNQLQTEDRPRTPPKPTDIATDGLTIRGGDGLQKDATGAPDQQKFKLEVPDILKRDALELNAGSTPGGPGVEPRTATEALKGNSDKLELSLGGNAAVDKKGEAGGKAGPRGGSDNSLPTLQALLPNLGTLARISGSPSNDYVEGVEEGEGTYLNAKEFKYATFFYRVKDSVSDEWSGLATSEYRRRDPTGNIYGFKDRSTLLRIQLNMSGEIDDIRVEQGSGVDFLDTVAVEAFRRAQPFPNPPAGIADADGFIRFNFMFVITMSSSRGIFRGFR